MTDEERKEMTEYLDNLTLSELAVELTKLVKEMNERLKVVEKELTD